MSFCMRHLDSYCVRVGSLNVGMVMGRGAMIIRDGG